MLPVVGRLGLKRHYLLLCVWTLSESTPSRTLVPQCPGCPRSLTTAKHRRYRCSIGTPYFLDIHRPAVVSTDSPGQWQWAAPAAAGPGPGRLQITEMPVDLYGGGGGGRSRSPTTRQPEPGPRRRRGPASDEDDLGPPMPPPVPGPGACACCQGELK